MAVFKPFALPGIDNDVLNHIAIYVDNPRVLEVSRCYMCIAIFAILCDKKLRRFV